MDCVLQSRLGDSGDIRHFTRDYIMTCKVKYTSSAAITCVCYICKYLFDKTNYRMYCSGQECIVEDRALLCHWELQQSGLFVMWSCCSGKVIMIVLVAGLPVHYCAISMVCLGARLGLHNNTFWNLIKVGGRLNENMRPNLQCFETLMNVLISAGIVGKFSPALKCDEIHFIEAFIS